MNLVPKCINLLLLCSILLTLGCASSRQSNTESVSVSISQEEFVKGIAKPIFELRMIIDSFYHVNAALPLSLSPLQDFAENNKIPFDAQAIKDWRVSNYPQETDITFQIVSPASLETSGQVTTSWRLTQSKSAPDNITVTRLSPFCIIHQQSDPMGDIFLRLIAATIVRKPIADRPGNKLCFGPLAGGQKMIQKEEQVKEKLHQKMQAMPQQRQNIPP